MIILLMILLSLSAVYFTRLLKKKGMGIAAITVAVLYIYLIVWTYMMFILDVADLGFIYGETRLSLLHGSNIYHSFTDLTTRMSVIPLPFLESIVLVAVIVLLAGFAVAFHGLFEITKEICKYVRGGLKNPKESRVLRTLLPKIPQYGVSILRMNCRANC